MSRHTNRPMSPPKLRTPLRQSLVMRHGAHHKAHRRDPSMVSEFGTTLSNHSSGSTLSVSARARHESSVDRHILRMRKTTATQPTPSRPVRRNKYASASFTHSEEKRNNIKPVPRERHGFRQRIQSVADTEQSTGRLKGVVKNLRLRPRATTTNSVVKKSRLPEQSIDQPPSSASSSVSSFSSDDEREPDHAHGSSGVSVRKPAIPKLGKPAIPTIGMPSGSSTAQPSTALSALRNLENIKQQFGGAAEDEEDARRKVEKEDPICSRITPHIFLGSNTVARDKHLLLDNQITHILNAATTACPNYHQDSGEFEYLSFPLADGNAESIVSCLYDGIEFIDSAVSAGGAVFVHCWQGVSRSTSFIVGWLILREGLSFDEALSMIKSVRSIARPNTAFMCQLMEWHKRLQQGPSYPILYKIAWKTHELVVPELHDQAEVLAATPLKRGSTLNSLNTNWCGLCHAPGGDLWLWLGNNCSEDIRDYAFLHAARLSQHEHANDAVVVLEGQEPEELVLVLE